MARRTEPQAPANSDAVDPALSAFASFVRNEEQQERDAKKQARAERQKADAANRLVAAKDAAAAEVKRLRNRTGVSPEERAAADQAYRDALAAVVAAETGEAPAWAPPTPEPEPQAEAETETETEAGVDAGSAVDEAPAEDAPADDEAAPTDA